MKKIILLVCVLFGTATMLSAQRAAERKETIKKGLKEEVKLSDTEITQVMQLEDEYRPKLSEIKNNESLSADEKKAKTKALNDEKKTKLETLVGKEKAGKVSAFYTGLKKKPKEGESKQKN